MGIKLTYATALLTLTLTACGRSANDPGPGGVSAEDAKLLDNAAADLDARTQPTPTTLEPPRQK
jgi:hypothetical protein